MMRLAIFAFSIFYFNLSYAQLSVRNDAYVFVKDQIIYVKDDINLTEAEAKIYLREESQLIQGDGITGNSGLGELSVYQQGNTNFWSYNYWCSPIGGVLANTTTNNEFRVNQLDDPLLGTASPIDSKNTAFTNAFEGSTTDSLTISRRWLYTYETADTYSAWNYVGDDLDVAPGLGFTMKGFGTDSIGNQSYDFRGKPNNGTIGNSVADGLFTLVGNPYPSAMDSALYIHDTDNAAAIDGTLYFWEQDGNIASHVLQDYVGGYYEYTINAAGDMITETPAAFRTYDENDNVDTLATPQYGYKSIERYIPIGQGFMVKGESGTPGTVYAKNAFRVYEKVGATSTFFRDGSTSEDSRASNPPILYQDNGLSLIPEDYKRFRINVDFNVNSLPYTRQLVLNFHDSATAGFDRGLELRRSENHPSDAYFTLDHKHYSGQAYPFEQSLIIPLNIDIAVAQPLRFKIMDIQNFDESQEIYLHDNENDTYVNLRDHDYELNITPGNYTDRFTIVFTADNSLSVEDELFINSLAINQINKLQELTILNPNGLDVSTIQVFDITGKRVFNQQYSAISSNYKLSTRTLSDGVYVVKVSLETGTVKSQKIMVKN